MHLVFWMKPTEAQERAVTSPRPWDRRGQSPGPDHLSPATRPAPSPPRTVSLLRPLVETSPLRCGHRMMGLGFFFLKKKRWTCYILEIHNEIFMDKI